MMRRSPVFAVVGALLLSCNGCGRDGADHVALACTRAAAAIGILASHPDRRCSCVARVAAEYLEPDNHRLLDQIVTIYLSHQPASTKLREYSVMFGRTGQSPAETVFRAADFVSLSQKIERLCVDH